MKFLQKNPSIPEIEVDYLRSSQYLFETFVRIHTPHSMVKHIIRAMSKISAHITMLNH